MNDARIVHSVQRRLSTLTKDVYVGRPKLSIHQRGKTASKSTSQQKVAARWLAFIQEKTSI